MENAITVALPPICPKCGNKGNIVKIDGSDMPPFRCTACDQIVTGDDLEPQLRQGAIDAAREYLKKLF